MTAYLFILGIVDTNTFEIRFEHKVVVAESEEDAYILGQRAAEAAGLIPVADHETANDYVVQLVAQ